MTSNPTPSPIPLPSTGNGARQNHHSSRSNKSQHKSISRSPNSSVPVLSTDTQEGSSGKKTGNKYRIVCVCSVLRLTSVSLKQRGH